MIIDIFGICS